MSSGTGEDTGAADRAQSITIRTALPEQAAELSEIALRAKGYWGYPADLLELWRTQFLTITPEYIRANRVWVAYTATQQCVAFAAVTQQDEETLLDDLWVLPEYIGQGIGKRLFRHVAAIVPEFVFTSDPHADGFYLKMGAQPIGTEPSVPQGRMLTRFRYPAR